MRAPSPRLLWIGLFCAASTSFAGAAAAQGPEESITCAVCAQADSLIAAGDTAAALILLRSYVAEMQDPHASGELGLLLARRVSLLPADSANRAEARALLEHALLTDPGRSRWALGYGLILWKDGQHDEALAWTQAALRGAGPRNGWLEPELLAELHAARGSIFEQRVVDQERVTNMWSVTAAAVDCPTGKCDLLEASLERLMQAPVDDDPGFGAAREAMRHHLAFAFHLNPLLKTSTYAFLADLARTGEWSMFVALARQYVEASGGAGWPLAFLGAGLWRMGDKAAAEATFEAALAAMDPAERDILEDIARSTTSEHERWFLSGDRESRVAWSRFLMRTADPLFLTPINERKLEHFTRVALAELFFGEPVNGLHGSRSAQGEILVRYGEPDVVRRVPSPLHTGRPRPRVMWAYEDERISFIFDLGMGRRGGTYAGNSEQNAESLREVQPSTYDFRVEPMRHQIARFQGARPELVDVDVHALLPAGPRGERLPGRAGFFLLPRTLHEEMGRMESPVQIGGERQKVVTFRFPMEASTFLYAVEAMTDDESVRARARGTLEASTFLDSLPALSDILLADRIMPRSDGQPRERRDLAMEPSGDLCFDRDGSLWLYFEVYGLSPDPGGAGRYSVVMDVADSGGRSVLSRATDWFAGVLGRRREAAGRLTWERTVPSVTPRTIDWFEVHLANARDGVHRITLTVTDLVSGGTASTQRSFAVGKGDDCVILPGTP